MAYFPAHCDHICEGCDRNLGSWCSWLDTSTTTAHTINPCGIREFLTNETTTTPIPIIY